MSNYDYKLTYFGVPFRAEAIRLTLVTGGANWEDERLTKEEWKSLKEKLTSSAQFTFPWLPQLEVSGEGFVISQSMVALRFVAKRLKLDGATEADKVMVESILELYNELFNAYCPVAFAPEPSEQVKKFKDVMAKNGGFLEILLEKNKGSGYLVGNQRTVADVVVYSVLREASKVFADKKVDPIDWSKLPLLKAHFEKIAKEPEIQKYYSK